MLRSLGRTALTQIQRLLQGFLPDGTFPCGSVLTVQDIGDRLSQPWIETCDRLCTPMGTLWTFWHHIHRDDPSCRAAVMRRNATRVAHGLAPGSPRTGGYGKPLARLAEARLDGLMP
jgi:hypothetical protein